MKESGHFHQRLSGKVIDEAALAKALINAPFAPPGLERI